MAAPSQGAFVYILSCSDGSYYTGTTRASLEQRVAEHNDGSFGGYTSTRRPVKLIYSEWFPAIVDAIACERRIKGWSKAKKEALIRGDFGKLPALSRRHGPHPSRRPQERAPQDED